MKANNRNEELVLAHFEARATPDQRRAAEAAGKTPAGAMNYARKQAENLPRVGGCVAVEDATVYAWTMRYFTDPTIPAAGASRVTDASKKRTAPAPKKQAQAAKPAEGAPEQLELFGGLGA